MLNSQEGRDHRPFIHHVSTKEGPDLITVGPDTHMQTWHTHTHTVAHRCMHTHTFVYTYAHPHRHIHTHMDSHIGMPSPEINLASLCINENLKPK